MAESKIRDDKVDQFNRRETTDGTKRAKNGSKASTGVFLNVCGCTLGKNSVTPVTEKSSKFAWHFICRLGFAIQRAGSCVVRECPKEVEKRQRRKSVRVEARGASMHKNAE